MAHEVYQLDSRLYSMAYAGALPWHTLGQQIRPDAPIEEWETTACMDWRILESPVCFLDTDGNGHVFSDQKVLYRSDTRKPLATVNKGYKPTQPRQVLEWFRSFVDSKWMTIETAGTLKGGKKMWALARINKDISLGAPNLALVKNKKTGDLLYPYVLLATSCDKSIANTARLTMVRVVCWNTLSMAYSQDNQYVSKFSHMTEFTQEVQDEMKRELGLVEEDIDHVTNDLQRMAKAGLDKKQATEFFLRLFDTNNDPLTIKLDELPLRKLQALWDAYLTSPGADLPTAKETLWGAVNAVTYMVDHNPNARSADTRLDNAWFGQGQTLKRKASQLAVDLLDGKTEFGILDELAKLQPDDYADRVVGLFA